MKRLVIVGTLLTALTLGLFLYNSLRGRVARLLGGRECVSVISAPETAQLFLTLDLLAKLTNGPVPDLFVKIEPGITLARPDIERLGKILLDQESYSPNSEDVTTPPEIILRFSRKQTTIELEFSDDFKTMLIKRNGAYKRLLNCEPARHELERAIGPLLDHRPPFWYKY